MNKTEKIIELKELLDSGLISSDDFERLKKQIFEQPEKVSFEIKKIKQVDILDNVRQKRNIFYDSIKKCTKCGSDNKLENKNCSVCKSDFPIVESKNEQKNYIENKKSDYKFYIFGILGFVLLFFGVSYFINNHNDKEQKESEVPTALDSLSVEPVPIVSVEENNNKLSDTISNIDNYIGNYRMEQGNYVSIAKNEITIGNSVCTATMKIKFENGIVKLVLIDFSSKFNNDYKKDYGNEIGFFYLENYVPSINISNINLCNEAGLCGGKLMTESEFENINEFQEFNSDSIAKASPAK